MLQVHDVLEWTVWIWCDIQLEVSELFRHISGSHEEKQGALNITHARQFCPKCSLQKSFYLYYLVESYDNHGGY